MTSSPEGAVLRGESTARAVTWDRSVRPGAPLRSVPSPVQLPELADRFSPAADDDDAATVGPLPTLLRGGATTAVAWEPERRAPGSHGRRHGDGAVPKLEQVYAAELDRLREQARAVGFAAGHAEGLAVAGDAVARIEAEAAQRLAETQQRWEARTASTVAALTAACTQVDATPPLGGETFDELVLSSTLTLVEAIFDRELRVAEQPGMDALQRALALSPADGPTTVRLNPDDLERIPADLRTQVPDTVRLIGDPGVEHAGAIAETGISRVDAQLGPALQRVREVLTG